ncbi:MAG: hypothetical protein EOO13_05220 [Chitinophagaceae bacterium]|nr:MAG: hypothetical protein EOO13_05220 [Chitinophagaceae bacterium]
MKYQIGDKIIVLHSDEEGKVIDIINEKMVMIEVRGVKFPAYMDQIDFPYFKMFTEKKLVPKKKIHIEDIRKEKTAARKKVKDGVFISFVPVFDKDVFDDDLVDKLKVYLINHNEEAYTFDYNLYFGGEHNFQLKSAIDGLADFYLHDIDFDDMSDSPRFDVIFSLQNEQKKKAPYFETNLKPKGKQLFKKIEELQKNNEASFSYELFTTYPDRIDEEKVDLSRLGNAGFRVYDAKEVRRNLPPARSVVDLHIEKLTDSWKHLSNFEILTMQLNEFEKYYDLAVAHRQKEFIVIHGVGEGKLREEIHELLKYRDEVKSFVNQYHHAYGYGATEIFFK